MKQQRGSIRQKMLRAFITVCLASLLVSGSLAVVGMLGLRNAAATGNTAIGTQAAETGGAALLEQALDDITELAVAKADVIDGELGKTQDTLLLLADYLSGIYQKPDNYSLLPFNHVRFNSGKTREMQWMISPNMTSESTGTQQDLIEAEVLEETFLQGNMQNLYETAMTHNKNISSIYTTGVTGVNTGYDDKSLDKLTDDISTDVADLRATAWYMGAEQSNGIYVTDTYRDTYGRGLCVTISAPYYGSDGKFAGAIGLDMLINDLSENVLQATVGETGYAILLNSNADGGARIIAAPGMDEGNEDKIALFLGDTWEKVMDSVRATPQGMETSRLDGTESVYIVWAPVTKTGWTFAFVMPEAEIIAPSIRIQDVIGEMTGEVVEETGAQIIMMVGIFAAVMLAVLALTMIVAARVSRRVSDPILSLAESVKAIGDGNLNYTSSITTGDEIEDLSFSFERMTVELKNYIKNLAHVTAEKERIGAELDVATKIQASMLPSIFPAFPERAEFDIFASMQPAKEVGGDFYDFFMINDSTLALVIADVSGKGVPAALFMVIAKTLIQNTALSGKPPEAVFGIVNRMLCKNNDAGMFVTAMLGYLDIPSGNFVFVNAGHNPPLLLTNGKFSWLKSRAGFVLAGDDDTFYRQQEITLSPGDELFLYTDGVTEAVNRSNELFSDPRLIETANKYSNMPLKEFTVSIKGEIDKFADGAEQADDITMLALRYNGEAGL